MKKLKFILLIFISMILLISCSVEKYVLQSRNVISSPEVEYVLSNYYPQLYTYYIEDVLKITSIQEYVLENNNIDYKIKYQFIKHYYHDFYQKIDIVKKHFPELYEMYRSGLIDITTVYKYVDKNTWKIRYHISYRKIYDLYYDDYHYELRHNPRHLLPRIKYNQSPPPPPYLHNKKIEPNRPSKPGGNPSSPGHSSRNNDYNPQRVPNNSQINPPRNNSNSSTSRSGNNGNSSRSGNNSRSGSNQRKK